ncbi:MAG: hypothetical protein BZ138_06025, partial [Methanosphaera sp. rholeuAM270]
YSNKGIDKTIALMEQAYNEKPFKKFYIYSIKTDTDAGFQRILSDTASKTEIRDVFYIEESESAAGYTIADKIASLKAAVADNYEQATPRNVWVIPYGTLSEAVTDATNVAPEATIVTQFTTLTTPTGSGRLGLIMPDLNIAGAIMGKIIGRNYDEEIGHEQLNIAVESLTYNFTDSQMLTLLNAGVTFVRKERVNGISGYRIVAGVSTSFKESAADGLLISRSIADELLRQVRYAAEVELKSKETKNAIVYLQTECNSIIADFVANNDVIAAGTKLTVSESSTPYTINIAGTIQPVGTILMINVDATINA